jgi:hypothetical protein
VPQWKKVRDQGGSQALTNNLPAGLNGMLMVEQTQQVTEALLAGPVAHGYKTALWALPPETPPIEDLTGVGDHTCHLWCLSQPVVSVVNTPIHKWVSRDHGA